MFRDKTQNRNSVTCFSVCFPYGWSQLPATLSPDCSTEVSAGLVSTVCSWAAYLIGSFCSTRGGQPCEKKCAGKKLEFVLSR